MTTADPTTSTAPSNTAAPSTPDAAPRRAPKPPRGPMRWVVLENLERQPITLLLDAHTEEHSFLRRQTVTVTDHNPKTGEQSARQERRRIPTSLSLCAAGTDGDKSTSLPIVVLQSAQVKAARDTGRIRVKDAEPPPAPNPAPAAETKAPAEQEPKTQPADGAPAPADSSSPDAATPPADPAPSEQPAPKRSGRRES